MLAHYQLTTSSEKSQFEIWQQQLGENHLSLLQCFDLSIARYIYLDSCNFAIAALMTIFWLQFLPQQQLHLLFFPSCSCTNKRMKREEPQGSRASGSSDSQVTFFGASLGPLFQSLRLREKKDWPMTTDCKMTTGVYCTALQGSSDLLSLFTL